MTYRFYSKPINGARVTVVGQLDRYNTLQIACARCSPKDNFERKKGRTIAQGRLNKGKLYGRLVVDPSYSASDFIILASATAQDVAITKQPVTPIWK